MWFDMFVATHLTEMTRILRHWIDRIKYFGDLFVVDERRTTDTAFLWTYTARSSKQTDSGKWSRLGKRSTSTSFGEGPPVWRGLTGITMLLVYLVGFSFSPHTYVSINRLTM